MNNGDMFVRKIDYPTLILLHIDRILQNINENGVTAIVETSIDALWASITEELKEGWIEGWEEANNMKITGKTEFEKMRQGKERVLRKLQLIMNILGEAGFLYRSAWEEIVKNEIKVISEEESEEE